MTTAPRAVCVYCGSRHGVDPAYRSAAEDLGRLIAEAGWQLVYGAGDVGLMGTVANAAQAGGADTMGVIPRHLLRREKGRSDLTRFVVTETMHERKKVMLMNSDAIVVLPGGAGTLDEFFEVLTWRQLGLHVEGLLGHIVRQGFAEESLLSYFAAVPDVASLGARLRADLS